MRGSAHTVTVGVLRFLPVGSGWVHFVRIGSHFAGLTLGIGRVAGPGRRCVRIRSHPGVPTNLRSRYVRAAGALSEPFCSIVHA